MRNNYSAKNFLITAALGIGLWIDVSAQIPVQNGNALQSKQTGQPQPAHNSGQDRCLSGKLTRDYIEQNGLQVLSQLAYQERQNTSTEEQSGRAVRTIPVIFHVIYDTQSATNVSNTVINSLLQRLNEDFRKNNSLIGNIRPAFTGVASDAQIEFCMATKDPSGNTLTTPGINRRQTTVTYFNPNGSTGVNDATGNVGGANAMKGATYGAATWDRSKYLNIWICDITNGQSFGVAGYAYAPQGTTSAGLPPATWDGVVLDYNIGVEGGASRTVSHEVGHYLGLHHTFGDDDITACSTAASEDDGFSDTPLIKGPFHGSYSSCSGSATTAPSCTSGQLWQYENLMDYGFCESMFTTQQANHMNSVLSGSRASLLTSTVTNCALPAAVAPVANFTGCNSNVTQNSTVTFTDASTGVPTSWSWAITPATGWAYVGGTSATSQNPQVQFTALGNYNVALTATNAQGNNTKTSTACITVVAAGACNNLNTALIMGFEATEDITGWTVENTNGDVTGTDPVTWGLFDNVQGTVAHGGSRMIGYRYNENTTTAGNDWFFTPCLALQSGTTYSISFWHKVHASGGVTYAEKLRVRIGNTNISTAMTQNIVDLGTLTNTGWVQSTTTFTIPTSGNYNIGFQCYSDADKLLLGVDDINISKVASAVVTPVANFTGCGNYATGATVTFTNTSTNSPTSNSWSITPATGWSFTGGTNASSVSPQVTFTAAGNYTVALTATNSAGSNTKTTSNCVVVSSTVVAPVANFTGCGNYATGATVTFTNTSTNSPTSNSWSITPGTGWSFTGGTNASSVSPQVTFTAAGNYTVALTATNSAGSNTKTTSNCVVVTQPGSAPTANFSGCGNYNTNSTVSFTNTSTGASSYSWSISPSSGWVFTGGTGATSANPQVIFNVIGTYTVTLTATNSIGSDTEVSSNCISISGITQPASANFQGCPPESVSPGTTILFANMSTGSPTSYLWEILPNIGWAFEPGSSNTSTNPQVTFTGIGYYSVSLTASNSAGTSNTSSPTCVVVSANAGIDENDAFNNVVLFPNPSTGLSTLSFGHVDNYHNLSVSVYNAVGVKLYQTSGQVPSELTLDFSAYSAGIYFVEIRSNEGVSTKRFILGK